MDLKGLCVKEVRFGSYTIANGINGRYDMGFSALLWPSIPCPPEFFFFNFPYRQRKKIGRLCANVMIGLSN